MTTINFLHLTKYSVLFCAIGFAGGEPTGQKRCKNIYCLTTLGRSLDVLTVEYNAMHRVYRIVGRRETRRASFGPFLLKK